MIFTVTIVVSSLIFFNFILLYVSCNRAPKLKANHKKDDLKYKNKEELKNRTTLIGH